MAAVKVRDCPCCGAPGKLKSVKAYVGFLRGWVGCPACGLYIHWAHDPDGAIAKWNRRVSDTAPAEDKNVPTTYDLLYEEGGPDA